MNRNFKEIVRRISLLENGLQIEIMTVGIFGISPKRIVNIQDIINPENNETNKRIMKEIGSWVILLKTKETFMITPGPIEDPEIFKSILRGEDIIVTDPVEEEDIIDV